MQRPLHINSSKESTKSRKKLIIRACDSCRKKKIRCEPVSDLCAQCIKSKTPCHFTPISILKNQRRLSREKRVGELEKRLAWMERQLSLPHEERQLLSDLEFGINPRVQDVVGFQPAYATSHASLGSTLGSVRGETGRIPQSSTSSQQMPASQTPSLKLRRTVNFTGKELPIFQELPSREKALHLITIYFHGINAVHPIFDRDAFISKFDSAYSPVGSDPGWWAALNVVFALAYQYWDMPDPEASGDLEASGYFQNALAATSQLMTRHYTLASVQALLGMAMLMMAVPNHRSVTLLTSSAVKIAQSLGLHRQVKGPEISAVENAERTRVFWIAYSLDKDISLQTKQPPTQGDEDMDIEPPSEGAVQLGGNHRSLFYFRTRLAIIQNQVFRRLLSVKSEKQSFGERARAAEELEIALQTWRMSIPIDLFCDYSGPALSKPPLKLSRPPIYLQLLYFKTLAVIRESLPIVPSFREIETSESRVHVFSALASYPAEARSALKLFSVTPRKKLACVWTSLHIFTTATTTLLLHIISNPSDHLVQADLKLLDPFLNLLKVVVGSSAGEKVEEAYQSSKVLLEQARMAVEYSSPKETIYRQKERSGPGVRESLEDFLKRMEHIRSGDRI